MSLRDQEIERKISSLEQQLQQYKATVEELSQDKEQLEEQILEQSEEIESLQVRIQELQQSNEEQSYESSFTSQLQKENLDLRRKVAAYEQTLLFKGSPENELKSQIFNLYKQIEDLEYQNKQLQSDLKKK